MCDVCVCVCAGVRQSVASVVSSTRHPLLRCPCAPFVATYSQCANICIFKLVVVVVVAELVVALLVVALLVVVVVVVVAVVAVLVVQRCSAC